MKIDIKWYPIVILIFLNWWLMIMNTFYVLGGHSYIFVKYLTFAHFNLGCFFWWYFICPLEKTTFFRFSSRSFIVLTFILSSLAQDPAVLQSRNVLHQRGQKTLSQLRAINIKTDLDAETESVRETRKLIKPQHQLHITLPTWKKKQEK